MGVLYEILLHTKIYNVTLSQVILEQTCVLQRIKCATLTRREVGNEPTAVRRSFQSSP